MRQEDRASLKRNEYGSFLERYFNPNSSFQEYLAWALVALGTVFALLFLVALFSGAISWSSLLVVTVFLAVAFSLRRK